MENAQRRLASRLRGPRGTGSSSTRPAICGPSRCGSKWAARNWNGGARERWRCSRRASIPARS